MKTILNTFTILLFINCAIISQGEPCEAECCPNGIQHDFENNVGTLPPFGTLTNGGWETLEGAPFYTMGGCLSPITSISLFGTTFSAGDHVVLTESGFVGPIDIFVEGVSYCIQLCIRNQDFVPGNLDLFADGNFINSTPTYTQTDGWKTVEINWVADGTYQSFSIKNNSTGPVDNPPTILVDDVCISEVDPSTQFCEVDFSYLQDNCGNVQFTNESCGEISFLVWTFFGPGLPAGGDTSNDDNPNYAFPQSGFFTIDLTIFCSDGNSYNTSENFFVNVPIQPTTTCPGDIVLTALPEKCTVEYSFDQLVVNNGSASCTIDGVPVQNGEVVTLDLGVHMVICTISAECFEDEECIYNIIVECEEEPCELTDDCVLISDLEYKSTNCENQIDSICMEYCMTVQNITSPPRSIDKLILSTGNTSGVSVSPLFIDFSTPLDPHVPINISTIICTDNQNEDFVKLNIGLEDTDQDWCCFNTDSLCVPIVPCPGESCCLDETSFCNLIDLSWNLTQDSCEVKIQTEQFSDCHWMYNQSPDWGDGSILLPAISPANGCWTHTYSESGVYTICTNIFEANDDLEECWSKEICQTIVVECDSLSCDSIVEPSIIYPDICVSQVVPVRDSIECDVNLCDELMSPNGNPDIPDDECIITCDSSKVTYFAERHPGSNYLWQVSGGVILGQNNLDSVCVQWANDPSSTIRLIETTVEGCIDSTEMCIEFVPSPIANFSINPNPSCRNTPIHFTDLSINADDWLWDFGDGNISVQKDPDHTYLTSGLYTVLLTVSRTTKRRRGFEFCFCETTCVCKDTISMDVFIEDLPGPPIYCVGTVCKGDTACYNTDLACAGAIYNWTVGSNGTVISGGTTSDTDICIVWNAGEIGDLSLQIPNCSNFCTIPTTVGIPVIDDNLLNINGEILVCNGDIEIYDVQKYGGSIYNWKVENGTILSSMPFSNSVVIEWGQFGSTGKVIVSVDHIKKNCSTTDTLLVDLRGNFVINGPEKNCEFTSANYSIANTGVSNAGFNWTTTGGTITSPNGGSTLSIDWNTGPGKYTITATAIMPLDFCNASYSFDVEVFAVPQTPTLIDGPLVICPGQTYNYTAGAIPIEGEILWSATNGTVSPSSGLNTAITWDNSGTGYEIALYQRSNIEPYCISDTSYIQLNALMGMSIAGPLVNCPNSTSVYNATLNPSTTSIPGEDIIWSISDPRGSIISGQGTNQVTIQWSNDPGAAVLTASICGFTDNLNLSISNLTPPVISGPSLLCPNDNGTVTVTGTFSNFSLTNATQIGSGNTNPSFNVTGGGTYNFTGLDVNSGGCPVTASITIAEVEINKTISANSALKYCVGDNPGTVDIVLVAPQIAGYTYQWERNCGSGFTTLPSETNFSYSENGINTNCTYRCLITFMSCTVISNYISTSSRVCNNPGSGSGPGGTPCMTTATADFTWNPCGFNKTFDASPSTGAVSYSWDFNDNSSGASGIMPSHIFSNVGNYNVCLLVSDGNCSVENCKLVTVPLLVDFSYNFVDCNNGNPMDPSYQFNDLSEVAPNYNVTSYLWEFFDACSNSTLTSNAQNPTQELCGLCGTPSSVKLTITVSDGVNTCTQSLEKMLNLAGSTADAIIPLTACVGDKIILTDNSCGNISSEWDYGDGNTSLLNSHCKTYDSAGNYTISLTVQDSYGCDSDPFTQNITIFDLPIVSLSSNPNPAEICEGQNATLTATPGFVNYNWIDATDNSTLPNTTNANTYLANTTGSYAVEVTDANGCISTSDPIQVTVYEFPPITIMGETEFCVGEDLKLFVAPGYAAYSWTITGLSNTSSSSLFNVFSIPVGSYTVQLTITDNSPLACDITLTETIVVHPNPAIPLIVATPAANRCEGELINLSIGNIVPGIIYQWSTGELATSIVLNPAIAEAIKVTATDPITNCSSESDPFNIYPLPDVCIVPVGCYEVCESDTICLPDFYASYEWFKDGISLGINTDPCIVIDQTGKYSVRLETAFGCVDTSGIIDITVTNCFCENVSSTYQRDLMVPDSCCWIIDIDNNYDPNFFKGIEFEKSLGGNFSHLTGLNGWSIYNYNNTQAIITPPTPQIPLGQSQIARLCMDNASYHEVELKWLTGSFPDSCVVSCTDTLIFDCGVIGLPSNCLSIVEDSISCLTEEYCFRVRNNSNPSFIINNLHLINLLPLGSSLTPNPISIPPLNGGNTSNWICVQYSGVADGDSLCYNLTGHFEDVNGNTLSCCSDTITHCSPVIESCICENVSSSLAIDNTVTDSCCWLIDIDNQYNPNFFKGIEFDVTIGGTINHLSALNGWSIQNYSSSSGIVIPPTSPVPLGPDQIARICMDNANYHEIELNWLTGVFPDSCIVACTDTLILQCELPDPKTCVSIVEDSISCLTDEYCFRVQNNSSPSFVINKIHLINLLPSGATLIPNPISIPALNGGNTSNWICVQYSGASIGDSLCFNLTAHFEDINGNTLTCCSDTLQHCSPVIEECTDCCDDFDEFCDLVDLSFQIINIDSCQITIDATQFDSCHWFGTLGPDWGDGSVSLPAITPAVGAGTWTHTYSQSGTYTVCITVYEGNDENDFCWNKQMCLPITVECGPCPQDTLTNCCLDFDGYDAIDTFGLISPTVANGWGEDYIDVDNDGDFDYLFWRPNGIYYFENVGTASTPNFNSTTALLLFNGEVAVYGHDFNNDGFTDIFSVNEISREIIYHENLGISNTVSFNALNLGIIIPGTSGAMSIAIGDLSNNGIADMLIHVSGSSSNLQMVYFEGNCSSPTVPCFTLVANSYASPLIDVSGVVVTSFNQIELEDGDCDGDLDIFMADGNFSNASPDGTVWYLENYGAIVTAGNAPDVETTIHTNDPFGLIGWQPSFEETALRFVDIDDDGKMEAFINTGLGGDVYFFENCKSGSTQDTMQSCCCMDSTAFCDLVDLGFQLISNDDCSITIDATQFDSCHWFGTPVPDWGDGSINLQVITPAVGAGPWTHTYSSSGTYNVCITVYEGSSVDDFCWNKQMCTEVTVECCDTLESCLMVDNVILKDFICDADNCYVNPFCLDWLRTLMDNSTANACQALFDYYRFDRAIWNSQTVFVGYIAGAPDGGSTNIYDCDGNLIQSCTAGIGITCNPDAGINTSTDLTFVEAIWNCGDILIDTQDCMLDKCLDYDKPYCSEWLINFVDSIANINCPTICTYEFLIAKWNGNPVVILDYACLDIIGIEVYDCKGALIQNCTTQIGLGTTCSIDVGIDTNLDLTDEISLWKCLDPVPVLDTTCICEYNCLNYCFDITNTGSNVIDEIYFNTGIPIDIQSPYVFNNLLQPGSTETINTNICGDFDDGDKLNIEITVDDPCCLSDTLCIIVPECPKDSIECCSDSLAFCNLVDLGFQIIMNDDCSITVDATQFDSCHWFGTPVPDWGDGSVSLQVITPTVGAGPWSHTYSSSGTYNVCITVYEGNSVDDFCWNKQMCTEITVDCPCDTTNTCDKLDFTLRPDPGNAEECCFIGAYENNLCDDIFKGIKISVSLPATIAQVQTLNGWIINQLNPMEAEVYPPTSHIPLGNEDVFKICNQNDGSTLNISMTWLELDEDGNCIERCPKDFALDCNANPGGCLTIVQDSTDCDNDVYCFKVVNLTDPQISIKSLEFIWTSPLGAVLTPNPVSIPPLMSGDTSDWVCVNYNTLGDPSMCFTLVGHEADLPAGEPISWCCVDSTKYFINDDACPTETCCTDSLAFCDLVDLGFTVSTNGCIVTVDATQFDSCHWYGTAGPDWGDGSITLPVFTPAMGAGPWTHSYTSSGSYNICITVYEGASEDSICWNKQMCTLIQVDCPCDTTNACDNLDFTISPDSNNVNECCYIGSYENNLCDSLYKGIKITVALPATIAQIQTLNGWIINQLNPTEAEVYPPSATIPLGSEEIFRICNQNDGSLLNLTMSWLEEDQDGNCIELCHQDFQLSCMANPGGCLTIVQDSTDCDNDAYCFKVVNTTNPGITIRSLEFILTSPFGATINPNPVSIPALVTGDTSDWVCINYNALGMDTMCFVIVGHEADLPAGDPITWCCTNTDKNYIYDDACNPSGCCTDYDAFCDLVNLGFEMSVDSNTLQVMTTQFDSCHWFLTTEPDWGDGSPNMFGPVTASDTVVWTHEYDSTGMYNICIEVYEGNNQDEECWSKEICKMLWIICEEAPIDTSGVNNPCGVSALKIPTGITPNGDGINDVLKIVGQSDCFPVDLTVFNRWGQIVWKQKDYDDSWGGTSMDGKELNDGTYFIMVDFHRVEDQRLSYQRYSGYLDIRKQ